MNKNLPLFFLCLKLQLLTIIGLTLVSCSPAQPDLEKLTLKKPEKTKAEEQLSIQSIYVLKGDTLNGQWGKISNSFTEAGSSTSTTYSDTPERLIPFTLNISPVAKISAPTTVEEKPQKNQLKFELNFEDQSLQARFAVDSKGPTKFDLHFNGLGIKGATVCTNIECNEILLCLIPLYKITVGPTLIPESCTLIYSSKCDKEKCQFNRVGQVTDYSITNTNPIVYLENEEARKKISWLEL